MASRRTHDGGVEIGIIHVADRHTAQHLAGTWVVPLAQAVGQLPQDVWITITFQFENCFANGRVPVERRFTHSHRVTSDPGMLIGQCTLENFRSFRSQTVKHADSVKPGEGSF